MSVKETWESKYAGLRNSNTIVRAVMCAGLPPEAAAVQLAHAYEGLMEEVERYRSIAPQAILYDGKLYRWDCPDRLVPTVKINPHGRLTECNQEQVEK